MLRRGKESGDPAISEWVEVEQREIESFVSNPNKNTSLLIHVIDIVGSEPFDS